jgi:hypothetical protein
VDMIESFPSCIAYRQYSLEFEQPDDRAPLLLWIAAHPLAIAS